MTKVELIDKIAESAGIKKTEAGRALEAFIESVTTTMKKGDTLTIPKFGTFLSRQRAARTGMNPRTREPVKIAACKVPAFKASSNLKSTLN
jgi:DNA-binding protein HU-beta